MHLSLSEMYCRAVIYLIALVGLHVIISQSAAELIIAPRNTESKVGEATNFNCSTNLTSEEIFWYHGDKYIYNGHGILEPYNGRFEIERNTSMGSHNLVIHSVEPGDAGEYICIDDDGFGIRRSAKLVVLDNDPDCQSNIQPDGVIGQNIFNIPPDEVQLTCTLTYHGKIPPEMEWKKVGDNSSIKGNVTSSVTSNNRLIYTLKLKGDISLDNSSYVCQTTRSTQNQYKCISEIIKVLYFVERNTVEQDVVRGDMITCIASNSTFPCTSQWYHDNYTCPLSCDETITTHLLGKYVCTVKCHVRGRDYYFEALNAFVVEPIKPPLLSISATLATAVVVPFVIVILAVAVVVVLRYKRRKFSAAENNQLLSKIRSLENDRAGIDKLAKAELPAINGLAVLGHEMFISRRRLPDIEVYDSTTFHFKRHINVYGMTNSDHIASCSVNNCLYAFDWTYQKQFPAMLRIDPTDGNLIKTWNIYGRGGRLSVASDTHVILNINFEAKLHEYTADGELIRIIDLGLGTDIFRVWQAAKLPNDLFVICQGCDGDPINRICLISTKATTSTVERIDEVETLATYGAEQRESTNNKVGLILVSDEENKQVVLFSSDLNELQMFVPSTVGRIDEVEILKEFGREEGESINRLNWPNCLSVNKEGSILVSDLKTVLLSSNLDKPRILISEEHGMGMSWKTCFDDSTGQWFVSDCHRIIVCRVEDETVERKLYDQRLGAWVLIEP